MASKLRAKKCEFCALPFFKMDGSNVSFCSKCSKERRKFAGQAFHLNSGGSIFVGNYLLSEKQARRFGQG